MESGNEARASAREVTLLYFVPDSSDAKLFARAAALTAAGYHLITIGFSRARYETGQTIAWQHVDLGRIGDGNYASRISRLIGGAKTAASIAGRMRREGGTTVLLARNLDMALLALVSRAFGRLRAPLVYEVLDIRRAMTVKGPLGSALRWLERRVLAAASRLWISAPRFASDYFAKVQHYRGAWRLIENKLVQAAPQAPDALPADRWVIGWFGTLRCARSLDILCRLAEALGPKLEIHMRGYPARIGAEQFAAKIRPYSNIHFGGSYSPADLPGMMAQVHFSWAFDYSNDWGNSRWLLPNRIYEAGYYERLSLADASHATGREVVEKDLGWAFSEDIGDNLQGFLRELDVPTWNAKRTAIAAMDKSCFYAPGDVVALVEEVLEQ